MNFRYRLLQFMSGRYGVDKLFYVMTAIAIILSFINIFLQSFILQTIVYTIMFFGILRVFSRNYEARRRENQWVCNKLDFIKRKKDFYNQKKADQCHIYKKCPACKAILRLPRRVGVHTTICPRCNKKFKVKVRK